MMNSKYVVFTMLVMALEVHCATYRAYDGKEMNEEEMTSYNGTGDVNLLCIKMVDNCTKTEGRRIDGSCNNPKYPYAGMAQLTYERMLPENYGPGNSLSRASDGTELPLARLVRTTLAPDALKRSHRFSPAAVQFAEFIALDVTSTTGIISAVILRQFCGCSPTASDPMCIPIQIPEDDPYLGGAVKCMNMSRAQALEDFGCITEKSTRRTLNLATPHIDLSTLYGVNNISIKEQRTRSRGQMNMVMRNNRYVPPNDPVSIPTFCKGNQVNETTCYKFGIPAANFDARLTIISLWFAREHNRLAGELSKINPCWDDEKLFTVSRQINIAILQNIYFYEWMPFILGSETLLASGVIYDTEGYVNDYDPHMKPGIFLEFIIATRFFHTMIEGRVRGYTQDGIPKDSFSISDQLFRPAMLEQGSTIEDISQGMFMQHQSEIDNKFDPEITERFFSQLQKANDLISTDIKRGRDLGIPAYYKFRDLCGLRPVKSFEDFLDLMDETAVEKIKKLYKSYRDVDLLAGIYSERLVHGVMSGPTLMCIMVQQSLLHRRGDRFWFEHGDQETSFTEEQVYEIKKSSISRLACDNGDSLLRIQPRGFEMPAYGNEQVHCNMIPGIELEKWKDIACYPKTRGWEYDTHKWW